VRLEAIQGTDQNYANTNDIKEFRIKLNSWEGHVRNSL